MIKLMDFSSQNPATSNALNLAARNNDIKNVERLLRKINPNCVDNRGWTCLHEAAYHDSYGSLKLILKDPRCQTLAETHEGHTSLYLACRNKCSLRTIRILLKSVEDIANYGSTEGVTPLHMASSQGRIELIQLLLEFDALIDVQDFDGDSPLHEAVLASKSEAVATLLHAGANAEINNECRFTPLHLACCITYFPNIESLFPFITDINQVTSSGDSPLTLAVQTMNDDVANFLLEHGADPNIKNNDGDMALDIAITVGYSEIFQKLMTVTDRNKINTNIVFNACKPHSFKFEILEILLQSDLGVEFFNHYQLFGTMIDNEQLRNELTSVYCISSPLNFYLNICAYIYDKSPDKFEEFFYLFLMRGVKVNASAINECPPLVFAHYVNTSCFREVFKILIDNGCDVDYTTCSALDADSWIPDAFSTSLLVSPISAPIMMPYSLYCDPETFLNFAYERGQLGLIPSTVQNELVCMIDSTYQNLSAEALLYNKTYVPCLKHLCRQSTRKFLRTNTKPWFKTTQESINIINSLPLPPVIKRYLRYMT